MQIKKCNILKKVSLLAALVVCVGSVTLTNSMSVQAQTVEEMQGSIAALQDKQNKLQAELGSVDNSLLNEDEKQKQYAGEIKIIEEQIAIYQKQLDEVNANIATKREEIQKMNEEIDQKEIEFTETKDTFKSRLDAMYIYSGNFTSINMLFGSSSFADFITNMEVLDNIVTHDQALMQKIKTQGEELKALRQTQEEQKTVLETDKAELLTIQDGYMAKTNELAALKSQSEQNEIALEAQKNKLQDESAEAKNEEAAIQAAIKEAQAKAAAEAERLRLEALANQGNQGGGGGTSFIPGGSVSGAGYLWPCPSSYEITSHFGPRWGTNHNGLDIGAGHGAPIVASRAGTVIMAVNYCTHDYGKDGSCGCGGGYGNYVMIDHGDGYQTLYGHNSSVAVSVGQVVTAGQVISYAGSTGYSTGTHLHFEVRQNGNRVDPEAYL